MRLVAVSIIKNEADIIEAFVRHTLAWVDHHLVFDHDSTDGTREILGALQREGLPVTLFCDDAPGHAQQARSNLLTRRAAEQRADWIFPLDADEILCGPDRPALERALQQAGDAHPVSVGLVDYCPTQEDNPAETNPVLRLRHRRPAASTTRKIIVPRSLALDAGLVAGKGSHALYRGTTALPDHPLSSEFYLAHFALRSPQHQVLRVARAELQRLSRGQAAAGLDVHYRLGYQLLAEDPELFFATVCQPASALSHQPVTYRGGALRHTPPQDWSRVARALFPYLEQLAASHGRLADITGHDVASPTSAELNIREISNDQLAARRPGGTGDAFDGYVATAGLGPQEGPVPEAFLPVFHWGYAPATHLVVKSPTAGTGRFTADVLTYADDQSIEVTLNGERVATHAFARVNQRDYLDVPLALRAGNNELVLRYARHLAAPHDPRQLAVIFLGLRIATAS